jgi:uncharacterized repeat protein (TIGR01451 family)
MTRVGVNSLLRQLVPNRLTIRIRLPFLCVLDEFAARCKWRRGVAPFSASAAADPAQDSYNSEAATRLTAAKTGVIAMACRQTGQRHGRCMKLVAGLVILIAALLAIPLGAASSTGTPGTGGPAQVVHFGSILPVVNETGLISLSEDAVGSNDVAGATLTIEKPTGATVRKAYMAAATTGFSGAVLASGDVTIDGAGVNWDASTPNGISSSNYWSDVTTLVKTKLDGAPAGAVSFQIGETNTLATEGEILAVIFNDPNQTTSNTIALLFGAQNLAGDTFNIGLAEPIDKSDPNLSLDMALGISYGFQGLDQYSTVEVNGQRLSSAAGGQDDGQDDNGALITVGGVGDSNANPAAPNATPNGDPRFDDELYNLLPFVATGDTQITVFTQNPSNDDNIFFAALVLNSTTAVVGEGIVLGPINAQNLVNTNHTLTATVQDSNGSPVAGRTVTFTVISGPNAGTTGTGVTGPDGKATFTYSSSTTGVDEIQASFLDSAGNTVLSNVARKEWTQTQADLSLTKTDAPDPVTVGDNLTYTLTVTNQGPDPSTDSTVTDTLPAGVTFVSAIPSQGVCSSPLPGSPVICSLGPLPVGDSATIAIVVTVDPIAVSPLSDTATVAGVEADPVQDNNSATAETTISSQQLDHFKCYKTKQAGTKFDPRQVILTDQFNTERVKVVRPEAFCTPVDKDGSGINNPTAHLACYKIRDVRGDEFPKFEPQHVEATDQFGTHTLLLKETRRLCLPASKSPAGETPGPPPTGLDHFKCYKTKQLGTKFDPRRVILTDQFNTERVKVVRPEAFCTPVDKDGSGIHDPTAHLACYKIRDVRGDEFPKFRKRRVEVGDQFGTHSLLVKKTRTLCLPSSKTVL